MSALCSPMCTIFIRDYLYFYGKYFVLRITTSMRIKRFIPENLYIIFPRILEILKSRTKNLEQRSAKNSVRIHGELICLCRAIDHRGFTVEERKMLSTRSRVFYSRLRDLHSRYFLEIMKMGALYIFSIRMQRRVEGEKREVFAFNQPLLILKSLWNVSAFDFSLPSLLHRIFNIVFAIEFSRNSRIPSRRVIFRDTISFFFLRRLI